MKGGGKPPPPPKRGVKKERVQREKVSTKRRGKKEVPITWKGEKDLVLTCLVMQIEGEGGRPSEKEKKNITMCQEEKALRENLCQH